jgi:hypothetical protein
VPERGSFYFTKLELIIIITVSLGFKKDAHFNLFLREGVVSSETPNPNWQQSNTGSTLKFSLHIKGV